MDRDDFIIAVFLVVCDHYQAIKKQYRLRRGGFAPALTDEEVITMEICGELSILFGLAVHRSAQISLDFRLVARSPFLSSI